MPERVIRYVTTRRYRGQLLGLAAAAFIQRSAVDLDVPTSLSSCPTSPNCSALVRAACSSVCTGTILALLPLPWRTRMVGRSLSSDRSRASTASASEILSPARHSIRNSNRALGFGAARIVLRPRGPPGTPGAAQRFSRRRRAVAWDTGPLGGGSARRLWSVGLPRLDFPLACV